jgi:hypothetical protein
VKGDNFVRYFYLLLSAAIISGCAQSGASLPPAGSAQSLNVQHGKAQIKIDKVSTVKAKQTQKIVISGSGFGTMNGYDGDSAYIQIFDTTGGWSAGHISSYEDDTVTLSVASWSDNKIVINGFTGGYGQSYWTLYKGDHLQIKVWNAQGGGGPASKDKKVK